MIDSTRSIREQAKATGNAAHGGARLQFPYHVTTDYAGAWIVIGPRGYVKRESDFTTAHALAKTLNEQHAKVIALADELVRTQFDARR